MIDKNEINLFVPGKLCLFGQYILETEIFNILEKKISNNETNFDEIQLTDALEVLGEKSGLYAYITNGEMYDLGNPREYVESLKKYYLDEREI